LLLVLISFWFCPVALAYPVAFRLHYVGAVDGGWPVGAVSSSATCNTPYFQDIISEFEVEGTITNLSTTYGLYSNYKRFCDYSFEYEPDTISTTRPFTNQEAEDFRKLSKAIRDFAIWTISQGMKVYPVGILLNWFNVLTKRS
jgi:hypothetical protein